MVFRPAVIALALVLRCAGAGTPMPLISAPALSPDGGEVVFEWREDLWIASSEGGQARRVVGTPGRDSHPRFSPDGKRIVFSSDRSGAVQLYSVGTDGGETTRHTHHSEGCELACVSPDGRHALVRGFREHHGFRSTRLMEIDLTTVARERRIFDAAAHSPAWSPDGKTLLFCRGGEQLWRKGYKGARASRIWSHKPASGVFTLEVPGDFEARSPLWLPDGSGFYFVSNQTGTANLWLAETGAKAKQLTFHEDDGVITPDLSRDGSTIVFRMGTGVYRMRPGIDREAMEIRFHTNEEIPERAFLTKARGCAAVDLAGDGKGLVFAAEGELWWMSGPDATPARMTTTAEHEDEPVFSPDGKHMYYVSDDGLSANYRRTILRDGKPGAVENVTNGTGSRSGLRISPDGKRIAWIQGAGNVRAADADGTNARLVFQCWDRPTFDWSPDGRWLAIAAKDRNSNRDILLVRADGSEKPVNLTRHPAFEGSPKWSPDGRWLVFNARRDASGKFALWKIDFGPAGIGDKTTERSLIRAGDRARPVSTRGIEPTRVIWHPDSKHLWFQSRTSSNDRIHSVDIDGEDMKPVSTGRGIPVRFTTDGGLFLRANRVPQIRRDGGNTSYPIDLTVERPRGEVTRLAFRRIWRTLGERFHDPRMNGRDWDEMLRRYETPAAAAGTSRQFDFVVSRLVGELNASHLSFHRKPWPGEGGPASKEPATAHTGIVFDDRNSDPSSPLSVRRVLPGSPAALAKNPPRPGETVVRIAGLNVTTSTPLHELLNGAEGNMIPITLRDARGNERVIDAKGISYRRARTLDARAEVETAGETVARISPGTAYISIRDMSRKSLETLELAVHRMAEDHQRMILDLRGNTGGREADRMLSIFTQVVHSHTIPRDGPKGYPMDRMRAPVWDKPLVVLCNADSYSNSEILCHAVKQSGRAPLVGARTAGGVISAVNTAIPDAGSLQVPFRSWFLTKTGENLDLNGAIPDHPVDLGPADEDEGTDPQLLRAIEVVENLARP